MRRLLVVSHPAVLAVNQLPYAALRDHGWDPWLVVPARWRHEYSAADISPECLPELAGHVVGRRVVLRGRVQRHFYATNIRRLINQISPDVAFVEAEPTALPTFQWGRALNAAGVPFGVQVAENLPRHYPLPARVIRRWAKQTAAFVVARSPTAARLVQEDAPSLPAPVVPHHVPDWPSVVSTRSADTPFTVGFAGRLVPEKGLDDLVEAVQGLPDCRLRLVGDGPLRERYEDLSRSGAPVEVHTGIEHAEMARAYSEFDVLALPSLTTSTWVEQFGRVLVEALWCGVPVIGSDSGEIPWVIETTGGGLVFREGDVGDLRHAIDAMRTDDGLRRDFAQQGRRSARQHFSVAAVARGLDSVLARTLHSA